MSKSNDFTSLKRETSALKRNILQLEGQVNEFKRLEIFDKGSVEAEISSWNENIVSFCEEIKSLLQPEQYLELQNHLVAYCKKNNLSELFQSLELEENLSSLDEEHNL